jgi:hypothetical protein
MKMAPGCRLRSWTTFRASIGSARIACSLMALPTLASATLMSGLAASTVTV